MAVSDELKIIFLPKPGRSAMRSKYVKIGKEYSWRLYACRIQKNPFINMDENTKRK